MGVTHASKKLIPAPFLAIACEANIKEDGKKLDWTYQLTLTGKLCADKGSPTSMGTWHTASGYPADEVTNCLNEGSCRYCSSNWQNRSLSPLAAIQR